MAWRAKNKVQSAQERVDAEEFVTGQHRISTLVPEREYNDEDYDSRDENDDAYDMNEQGRDVSDDEEDRLLSQSLTADDEPGSPHRKGKQPPARVSDIGEKHYESSRPESQAEHDRVPGLNGNSRVSGKKGNKGRASKKRNGYDIINADSYSTNERSSVSESEGKNQHRGKRSSYAGNIALTRTLQALSAEAAPLILLLLEALVQNVCDEPMNAAFRRLAPYESGNIFVGRLLESEQAWEALAIMGWVQLSDNSLELPMVAQAGGSGEEDDAQLVWQHLLTIREVKDYYLENYGVDIDAAGEQAMVEIEDEREEELDDFQQEDSLDEDEFFTKEMQSLKQREQEMEGLLRNTNVRQSSLVQKPSQAQKMQYSSAVVEKPKEKASGGGACPCC